MEPKTSDTTGTDEAPPQAAAPAKKMSAWDRMMLKREETRDAKRDKKGNLPAPGAGQKPQPAGRPPAGKKWEYKIWPEIIDGGVVQLLVQLLVRIPVQDLAGIINN